MSGEGGASTDLTGLSPEEIAVIGNRRSGNEQNRMKVADLLRLSADSKAKGLVEQQKIGQTQQQIDQTESYQTEANRLREIETANRAAVLTEQIKSNKANQALRGSELKVSERRIGLDESLKDTEIAEAEARATGNIAQADYHSAQAKHQQVINTLVDSYISGGQNSDIGEAVAKKALGLPTETPSQKRLRLNDMSNAEIQLLDSDAVDSAESFSIANDVFLNNAPDTLDRFYIWDTEWNNEVIQVPLPSGKTLADVKAKALELGQSLEKTMQQIYEAGKK